MNYIIYGAGFMGLYLCDLLQKKGIIPKYLLDKDKAKWHMKWNSVEIVNPKTIIPNECTVIVAHSSAETINAIKDYLKELNYKNVISIYDFAQQGQNKSLFTNQRLILRVDIDLLYEEKARIQDVTSMFSDYISIKTYSEIISALSNMTFEGVTHLPLNQQYMAYDVFHKINNEVFVDIGAGPKAETLFLFLKNNVNFDAYYMFEPCDSIFNVQIPEDIKDKVVLIDCAVGEFEQELNYKNYMDSNALIIENEKNTVKCIRIDDFFFRKPPTFLKIDTEGYDKAVLKGASKCIKKYRPIVACAIYHNISDFWEIPLMLQNLPDYKFYLRSYMGVYETILYAVPKERTL